MEPAGEAGSASPGAPRGAPGHADRAFLHFLFATLLIGIVFFQLEAAMPLYVVRDLTVPEKIFGLSFTVNTVLILVVEVPLNAATSKWSHRRSLGLGALLCAAGFGALVFARNFLGVAATVVVWTFGEMILFPAMAAYVADVAPPARTGEYMGLYTTAFGVAFTLGPVIGTTVLERFGATVLWAGAFIVGAVAAAMMSGVRQPAAIERA
jgi:MFS family permease